MSRTITNDGPNRRAVGPVGAAGRSGRRRTRERMGMSSR